MVASRLQATQVNVQAGHVGRKTQLFEIGTFRENVINCSVQLGFSDIFPQNERLQVRANQLLLPLLAVLVARNSLLQICR